MHSRTTLRCTAYTAHTGQAGETSTEKLDETSTDGPETEDLDEETEETEARARTHAPQSRCTAHVSACTGLCCAVCMHAWGQKGASHAGDGEGSGE